jgi:hypothetical protein
MGFLDFLKKKEEKTPEEKVGKKAEKPVEAEEETGFNEPCALCGKAGTEKKWAGQYWHKKCLRAARKGAKGMI